MQFCEQQMNRLINVFFLSRINPTPASRNPMNLAINFSELAKHFEAVQQLHGKMIRDQRSEAVVSKAVNILDLSDDENEKDEKL